MGLVLKKYSYFVCLVANNSSTLSPVRVCVCDLASTYLLCLYMVFMSSVFFSLVGCGDNMHTIHSRSPACTNSGCTDAYCVCFSW